MSFAWAARIVNEPTLPKPFLPTTWQFVLTQWADEQGRLNFDRIKSQPAKLNLFLEQLQTISPDNRPEYFETPQDVLAYWLNAYNALALRLILDRYPVDSVSQVPNLLQDKRYQFGGIPMSLEMIQAKIQTQFMTQTPLLSKALFALTLYSEDTPPLAPQAYQGLSLKTQLDAQAKRFLGDPKNVRVIQAGYGLNPANTCSVMRLSPWFAQVKDGLEKSWNSRPNVATKMPAPKVFFETVKPYLSPEDHALMLVRCPHGIGYLPPNPTLRRIEP